MFSRRELLATSLAYGMISGRATAQDWQDVLTSAIENEPDNPIFLGREPLPASDPRWAQAKIYLDGAPTSGEPIGVARYFDATISASLRKEWPQGYANPLIVLLFAATNTKPAGDVTPWCAAFMSWCIERVGKKSEHSASSKDYRAFGSSIWSDGGPWPGATREGDIAVFKSLSNPSSGHVTFFIGPDPKSTSRVIVLGGNQSDQIGRSSFRIEGDLRLISIRRLP